MRNGLLDARGEAFEPGHAAVGSVHDALAQVGVLGCNEHAGEVLVIEEGVVVAVELPDHPCALAYRNACKLVLFEKLLEVLT